jgi:isoleucyl-tRNA synthetase
MTGLVAGELNVKLVTVRADADGFVQLSVKPNFAVLGARLGARIKELQTVLASWDKPAIDSYRRRQSAVVTLGGQTVDLGPGDLLVDTAGPEGYFVESDGRLIVAVDGRLDDDLRAEGLARELVNRVQNTRKKMGFEVTDRIRLTVHSAPAVLEALQRHRGRIKDDTLSVELALRSEKVDRFVGHSVDLNGQEATIIIERLPV